MHITLIRHLPTEWNKEKKLQGRRDIEISPVSEDFQYKITENQQLLKKRSPFDLIVASRLKRTQQTAGLYGFQPEIEGLLDELDFGPFEGLTKEKLIEKYHGIWMNNPKALVLGESMENLEKRIFLFLDKYKDFTDILVFGHGSWIRAMISYLQYGDINKMNQISVENNACITLKVNPGM
ncbi:histidine phosphatase family protein [Bacillus salipaludis]|uniref:Histidine phosphatase family protein n=1 Tax=Bacillus salipaludis TaxID=2547811 RepID=A0ABW8RSX0_9BACI